MKSEMWEKNEMRETMKLKHLDLFSTYLKEDITRSIKCPIAQRAFSSYSDYDGGAVFCQSSWNLYKRLDLPSEAGEGAK